MEMVCLCPQCCNSVCHKLHLQVHFYLNSGVNAMLSQGRFSKQSCSATGGFFYAILTNVFL